MTYWLRLGSKTFVRRPARNQFGLACSKLSSTLMSAGFAANVAFALPALAEMTSCDVVTLVREVQPDNSTADAVEAYQGALVRLGALRSSPRALLVDLAEAQAAFLSAADEAISADAFIGSAKCRVLVKFRPALDAQLNEPELLSFDGPLRDRRSDVIALVTELEADLASLLSRARFRSEVDLLRQQGSVRCVIASILDAAAAPSAIDRPLERYGETVTCSRIARTSAEWERALRLNGR